MVRSDISNVSRTYIHVEISIKREIIINFIMLAEEK